MADFQIAYKRTVLGIEGGYDPGTNEAETYRGIDRSQNQHWPGWAVIDAVKAGNRSLTLAQLNTVLNGNNQLQANVQAFYKTNYWDVLSPGSLLGLDPVMSQVKANALFDCSVNPCIIGVVKAAQIACNVVKPKALIVDGKYGAKTLACINSTNDKEFDLAFAAVRQANYYERVRLTPHDADWLASWLYRSQRQT
ncbi:glycosyl hydrolase 108 family protein [Mucilaginibacter sp. L3T2-6]|uniref:glycosyl hydrolase 108 family protein n=1 Tax=Mucilaginibacter sp. L3T2-6 TaxID=3062491 RepID=UPI002675563E|nr:glycosyl hydrolase 108 family protein [Mucilaginibacter sp. L3T2-6]MDO3641986.1 glycosyl hydrolase 108 family protein [Mucilaginibacter sp. L3T2-6]MDV6214336.1 glycosyl hydrolase 108 family protein [Mucilaginibacter sp. L3T2-6]